MSRWNWRPELLHPPENGIWCPCIACDHWRASQIAIGSLVYVIHKQQYVELDSCGYRIGRIPEIMHGGTPVWRRHEWSKTGWDWRIERDLFGNAYAQQDPWVTDPMAPGLVKMLIPENENDSGGHLDCALIEWPALGEIVTSRKWLQNVGGVQPGDN